MKQQQSEELLTDCLQRCLENDNFLIEFYRRFIDSSDEIKTLFRDTDIEAQQKMMAKSLMSMISASDENWLNDNYLTELAATHKQRGIKPEHYELWEESLLATIKDFDDKFSDTTESAWKQVIQRGKQFMSHPK